jgi:hypothetical protein
LRDLLSSLFDACIRTVTEHPPARTRSHAYIEEYADYFVVSVERTPRSLHVTHYYDEPTRLIVLYGELRDPSGRVSAAQALRLSLGYGSFRLALGSDGELCLRADYDPAWDVAVALPFARDVLASLEALLDIPALDGAPASERPLRLHVAETLGEDAAAATPADLARAAARALDDYLGVDCRTGDDTWRFPVESGPNSYICVVRLDAAGLVASVETRSQAPLGELELGAALERNYHIRFVKLCAIEPDRRALALELPMGMIRTDILAYYIPRLKRYVDHVREAVPDFL